jgi:hypothetical protein
VVWQAIGGPAKWVGELPPTENMPSEPIGGLQIFSGHNYAR